MTATQLTHRYLLLRAEIRRRMAFKDQWSTLPGLLDEMHRVRSQQRALSA
jgi:hypothetical protein